MKTPPFCSTCKAENSKIIYEVTLPRPFATYNKTIKDRKVIDPKTAVPYVTYKKED
ncbi:MAG: hypothetical protein J5582_13990 [Ruminococcus sp.]|uniref:hypothetical protein n=1 Tax=Ruminococcus sp. TaxID=41978 RepID=UPI0026001C20|nr:hypothetical protein [Ruminococcus sp.]MBO4867649.1 hypothetical protein [Ruminococcus sp.]